MLRKPRVRVMDGSHGLVCKVGQDQCPMEKAARSELLFGRRRRGRPANEKPVVTRWQEGDCADSYQIKRDLHEIRPSKLKLASVRASAS